MPDPAPPATSEDPRTRELMTGLARGLRERGLIRSPHLERAFASTPRHRFVDSFLEPDRSGVAENYGSTVRRETSEARWREAVYANQTLVTAVQGGQPSSSSSMPSIMAAMIEEAGVEPGMRVLEVGTGTGYNAAILAACVGAEGRVCSIENQPDLAERAAARLAEVVPWPVRVHTGDGWQGDAEHAPFDRIIATSSAPRVPAAWLRQLRPAGRVVLDLRGGLAGGLLIVLRETETAFSGRFADPPLGSFMPLQEALPSAYPEVFDRCLSMPAAASHPVPPDLDPERFLEHDSDLLWMVQCQLSPIRFVHYGVLIDGKLRWDVCLFFEREETVLRFAPQDGGGWRVGVLGPALALWDRTLAAYRSWAELGCPVKGRFRWEGTVDGSQWVVLDRPGLPPLKWPL